MHIALLIILITYQAIMSILDKRDIQKYTGLEITENHRIKFYKEAIVFGSIPVLVILIFITASTLSFSNIGIRNITLSENIPLNIFTGIVSSLMIVVLGYQTVLYFISPTYRKQIADELNKKEQSTSRYDKVMSQILIPNSKLEKKWFLVVCITAGVCEEIIWRGCVIFLLNNIFPSISIIIICAISCLLFGLAHIYQGIYGVIKTSVIAILFVLIYLVTDSIIPGILLHFFVDFSSAFLVKSEI